MVKKESRFLRQQKIALGVLLTLVIAIIGYFLFVVADDAPLGEFVEGEHYFLIDDPRRIRGDKIEVIEFFSYACVHCYNFDPELKDWVSGQGDRIEFVQMPALASDYWRLLGRNYYTMEKLGLLKSKHMAFFRSVHDGRVVYKTPEGLAAFFDGDPEDYLQAYRSPEVNSKMALADTMARRLKIAAVPTIVIQGKYMVSTSASIGLTRMLEVMDYLVEKERTSSAGNPVGNTGEGTGAGSIDTANAGMDDTGMDDTGMEGEAAENASGSVTSD